MHENFKRIFGISIAWVYVMLGVGLGTLLREVTIETSSPSNFLTGTTVVILISQFWRPVAILVSAFGIAYFRIDRFEQFQIMPFRHFVRVGVTNAFIVTISIISHLLLPFPVAEFISQGRPVFIYVAYRWNHWHVSHFDTLSLGLTTMATTLMLIHWIFLEAESLSTFAFAVGIPVAIGTLLLQVLNDFDTRVLLKDKSNASLHFIVFLNSILQVLFSGLWVGIASAIDPQLWPQSTFWVEGVVIGFTLIAFQLPSIYAYVTVVKTLPVVTVATIRSARGFFTFLIFLVRSQQHATILSTATLVLYVLAIVTSIADVCMHLRLLLLRRWYADKIDISAIGSTASVLSRQHIDID